jgi:5-methylcytosine-specific restriction enzyme subunit McrC
MMNFVGAIRTPEGFQIEVLPKIGKVALGSVADTRTLLLQMLACLRAFRHIQTRTAHIAARRMPLLEVFIAEFLRAVESVVAYGLRGNYVSRRSNLAVLRGKLVIGQHMRHNLCRRDRFLVEHDEFLLDRPVNRLLHTALLRVLRWTTEPASQRRSRVLLQVFAEIPVSSHPKSDWQRIQLGRDMSYYAEALAWARLILDLESPLASTGVHSAPSLLFPMEAVFEAFVARSLPRQLVLGSILKSQLATKHLVRHNSADWFRLKPDLLIKCEHTSEYQVLLDTKWKLIDASKGDGKNKYGISQSDIYQLHAYGHSYLNGVGDLVLVYPENSLFSKPLPKFEFLADAGLRLWVLPFCLETRELRLPDDAPFADKFRAHRPIKL